jgi:hypothetical protein
MNSTPGTSSAIPSSIYLLTTYDHTKEKAPIPIGISKFDPNLKNKMLHNENFETLLISWRSFSVISVFRGLIIWPIRDKISWPPCGWAFAASRSCSVTSYADEST